MKILYFAWMREHIGHGEDILALPPHVTRVNALIAYLRTKGAGYEAAFKNETLIRVALDQQHAALDSPLDNVHEIAFFPPVTGG